MTIKVLNVNNGDYKIVVGRDSDPGSPPTTPAAIILDTRGPLASASGEVWIYGNLNVEGSTTYLETTNTNILDRVITLNKGGPNLSTYSSGNQTSGIEIEGVLGNAYFIFNHELYHRDDNFNPIQGSFDFRIGTARAGIYTSSINVASNDNLYLINQGTGVVTVQGTTNYEENVLDYPSGHTPGGPYQASNGPISLSLSDELKDALVNTQGMADYVTSSIYFTNITHITNDNTEVRVFDASSSDPSSLNNPSYINFKVDAYQRATIDSTSLNIPITYSGFLGDHFLKLSHDGTNALISVTGGNRNIELDPSGTGKVKISSDLETTGVVQIGNQSSVPSTSSSYNVLYSKSTLGMGKTGLYFTNPNTSDELVSRRRALGFSMIF